MPLVTGLSMIAAGHRHGPMAVSSVDLEARYESVAEGWSERYLGMTERRRLRLGEDITPLAVEALNEALDLAGWRADRLDVVICGTTFVDQLVPTTSALISQRTNPDAVCFDVNACCAGLPVAVSLAASLFEWDRGIEGIAVCIAENISPYLDHNDPESSIFFGDAAGAAVLTRDTDRRGFVVRAVELAGDSRRAERVSVPRYGTFGHDGRYSYEQVVRLSELTGRRVLDLLGLTPANVRAFVGHQSSMRLLDDVGRHLDIDPERQWRNVRWAGNQGGAGALTALSRGWGEHADELKDGDIVLVASVGAGYVAGAIALQWRE